MRRRSDSAHSSVLERRRAVISAAEERHVSNYRLQITPVRFNGRFHLHYYPDIARELATVQPDLLHMDEEPYNYATWHALRAAARQDIPGTFFTWQNLDRRYPPPFQLDGTGQLSTVRPLPSRAMLMHRTVLRGKGYTGEIAVIPQFGVDPATFTSRKRSIRPYEYPASERHDG